MLPISITISMGVMLPKIGALSVIRANLEEDQYKFP
jgi:hypothetical protein